MPRQRRRIKSKTCYEICFRARQGLPLAIYELVRLLIGSSVARTQRDGKVIMCHDIWNGSHAHIIAVALDSEQCTRFYGEIQKRLTDAIKRLLGLKHLDLWEGHAMVAEVVDLDMAIKRISYIYANPAQDNLVESIEQFPGYSSWNDFNRSADELGAQTRESFPWIRLTSIPRLRSSILSPREDLMLVRALREKNKLRHGLVRRPNAWMRCFGIEKNIEVIEINERIFEGIKVNEEEAQKRRTAEKKTVMGIERLRSQPIMKAHTPKKHERKISILCSIKELRIQCLNGMKLFCDACRECYLRWKAGDFTVKWPPGAFKPPLSPSENILPDFS